MSGMRRISSSISDLGYSLVVLTRVRSYSEESLQRCAVITRSTDTRLIVSTIIKINTSTYSYQGIQHTRPTNGDTRGSMFCKLKIGLSVLNSDSIVLYVLTANGYTVHRNRSG